MANSVPDRANDSARKVDMNNPCKTCGMIHVDPKFDYKKHEAEAYLGNVIGNALFKGL